jgi:hypothetical protein
MLLANLDWEVCYGAHAGLRAANAEVRVRACGRPANHAATRAMFIAVPTRRWSKRVLATPM